MNRFGFALTFLSLPFVLGAAPRTDAGATPNAPPSLLRSVTFHGKKFDVVEIPLDAYALHAGWRARGSRLKDVEGEVRMNAGIFEPGFTPTGLLVASGVELHPLNRRVGEGNFYLAPNGVFAVRRGSAVIEETSRYDGRGVSEATQSGPLLVARGRIHPLFREASVNVAIRNGVGVRDGSHVAFVISREPVTLWLLARFFRDELHCPDALYLDGAISGLWAANAGRDAELEKGPFAGVLTVTHR